MAEVAATVGMGVLGAGTSLYGASSQASASEEAANAQAEAADRAAKLAEQQYKDSVSYSWPWYSGGVAAENQLLNLMGLGSQQTANTQTGTAGGYADPSTTAIEAAKIREAIAAQQKAGKGTDKLEKQLAKLQKQYTQFTAKGKTDKAAGVQTQIGALQAQLDAANGPQAYDLSGLKNPTKTIRKMTDLEVYKAYGPQGQYGGAQAGAAGTGTASTTGTTGTTAATTTDPVQLQQQALAKFQTDPGYLFRLQEGEKSIMRNRAATGGAQSGAALKALEQYSQGVASNEYGNWYNRLASLAGQGQSQTNQNATLGANAANSIGDYTQASGQARATGYINQGNAWASGLNNMMSGIGGAVGSYYGNQNNGGWGSSGFPYNYTY